MTKTLIAKHEATVQQIAVGNSRVRYRVLGLTVCLAAITYLDRVCISIIASQPRIKPRSGMACV